MDYQIVVFDKTTGLASVQIPMVPKIISGMTLLTQIVVLSFLRNPGQDVFAPTEGSGFRQDIGQYNYTDGSELKSLVVQRVKFVEQEIIGRQNPDQGDPTEKLKQLKLMDFAMDSSTSEAVLRVQIINEAGDSTDILV